MTTVSAASVALAAWCGAAAGGGAGIGTLDVPLVALAAVLVGGVVGAAARRSTAVLPPGKDVVVLTAVSVAGFVGLYLAGWTDRGHLIDIARLLPLAVVALSVLWPEPNVLRYCLLLAAGTLLGTVGQPVGSREAVAAALAAIAVGLVSTNRLATAARPRLGGAAPATRRRVAAESAAVLAVVGLLAALAASLLPPPPGDGGGLGRGNRRGRVPPAGPPVQFADRLDVGAGRGERGGGAVLLVEASAPEVWRATTYDHWDGESWSRRPESPTDLEDGTVGPGVGDDRRRDDVGDGSDEGTAGLSQTITVQARYAEVLAAAARPTLASVFEGDVRQGADATLYPTPALGRGGRYVVFSDRPPRRADALRAPGTVPADVADAYLQLPQVSPRVRALAAQVTAGASTTFDRARALEDWILDNTTITDDAVAVPPGTDPLESFLLTERSGPPERAATSMAVMLRALGVPARMAVGFLPGERIGPDRAFLVRSSDTHAWVEVWFPVVGWQRFDPTGRAPDPRPEGESVLDRLVRFLGRLWPLVAFVAVAAGAWLAWRGARWWKRRAALPWATRFFARMERAGTARGRPRQPQETPAEYAAGLATGVLPDPRLVEVGELVTVAAWSQHEPAAADRAHAEDVLRDATRAAPARRWKRRSVVAARRRRRPQAAQGPTIPRP